ncbi:hypothetical protein MNBD_GAMMA07-1608 [hydrothermal vent metagenome]|uniref:Uncharacterized protein n=1 Tax=hydrothermal vent metagenome TaxID=652676 RepID=A0A3B0XDD3_9ZZZZ
MIKTKNTPFWVFLAFSAIETRKGALLLVWSSVLFTVYSLPWSLILGDAINDIGKQLLLIDDWSWIAMMAPMTLWYIISLKWMDNNEGWIKRPAGANT